MEPRENCSRTGIDRRTRAPPAGSPHSAPQTDNRSASLESALPARHGRMRMVPLRRMAFLFTAALLAADFAPAAAHAYGGLAHEYLSEEASKVFPFPALSAHLDWVKAEDEDHEDHIYGHSTVVTCTHFWDADDSDLHHTYYVALEGYCANAYMKADELFDGLFEYWQAGDWQNVYEYIGHITHLIADMTVPAHAHVDYHPSFDSYDDGWSNIHYDRVTADDATADGGRSCPRTKPSSTSWITLGTATTWARTPPPRPSSST